MKNSNVTEKFKAEVVAKIVELRFPFAGEIAWVGVSIGDQVKKGQQLVKLNTKILQKRLEKENKDYIKKRALFEQIKKRFENLNDPDKKYILDRAQADLDAAVLAVELSQLELDKAILKAPADGVINDDGNLIEGQNITPASFSLEMIVNGTLKVSAKLSQEKFHSVKPEAYAEFIATALPKRTYKGRVLDISPMPPDKRSNNFLLNVVLEKTDELRPGMQGLLSVFKDR